jgi:hypothetical protein
MAHYAFLDENDIVVNVISGVEETELVESLDSETGLMRNLDTETHYGNDANIRCVRTSYNTIGNTHRDGKVPFRKNFAQPGYKYDGVGFFDPVKPFASWTFNTDTYLYDPPVERPVKDVTVKNWNTEIGDWEEVYVPWVKDWVWNESEQKWTIDPIKGNEGDPVSFYEGSDTPHMDPPWGPDEHEL